MFRISPEETVLCARISPIKSVRIIIFFFRARSYVLITGIRHDQEN